MRDEVLNAYINKLLSEDIEEDKFREYIDIFSRFLGYANPDYKYNGTYISQYIDDFQKVRQMLRRKNKKYDEVFMGLMGMLQNFELVIDGIYYAKCFLMPQIEREYSRIEKNRIVSNSVEVKITIELGENEYTFCKEYDDFEYRLFERVKKDMKNFIKKKKIRRASNDIA